MRIAVASDDGNSLADHFGNCGGFVVFEARNESLSKLEYRINDRRNGHHFREKSSEGRGCQRSARRHNEHDDGCRGHERLIRILKDCDVVLIRDIGHRAAVDLERHNIKPVITDASGSAQDAVEFFLGGKLSLRNGSSCRQHAACEEH